MESKALVRRPADPSPATAPSAEASASAEGILSESRSSGGWGITG